MITRRELDSAIRECEDLPASYGNCEKLAVFYTILDHAFGESEQTVKQTVEDVGGSDFLQAVKGKDPEKMWLVMDELMDTLLVTNPRLYDGVMRMINGQG